jgi:hypothetical protein
VRVSARVFHGLCDDERVAAIIFALSSNASKSTRKNCASRAPKANCCARAWQAQNGELWRAQFCTEVAHPAIRVPKDVLNSSNPTLLYQRPVSGKGASVANQIKSSQEMSCNSLLKGGPTRKLENLTFRPERSGVQHIGPTA